MKEGNGFEERVASMLRSARHFKRFPTSGLDMERFLTLLYEQQPVDLWELTKKSDAYVRVLLSLLFVLEKDGFISIASDGKMKLTKQGLKLAKYFTIKKIENPLIEPEQKIGLRLTPKFKMILETVRGLYQEVIPQNRYDQAPLLPESAVYKVAYAISKGDATNKSVVCVGDDDLTSIIFALSGVPKRVLAVDIDKYLLEMIEEYSEKKGLGIETLQFDLREPVPGEYRNSFDLFMTEPPDTVAGITLFVSRGVELLKNAEGMTGYCGVSPTACPPLGLLQIQKDFTSMGLLIADRIPKYSDYPPHRTELKHVEVPDCYDAFYPPKKVWYSADLLRLKTTKETKPLFNDVFKGKLANYSQDSQRFQ